MEDDEPLSVMLEAVKQKKKSTKKSESSPNESVCCPISPDQPDLEVISGLLNLQSTPAPPQEQKHEIPTQQTSSQSSPVHEGRSEPNSIVGAGRKRGRKRAAKHINSDHPNGNGCLQKSEGVLGHREGFACQPNILQEICEDKVNLGFGKCLVLDEEKREFIAQEMARSCRNDARLRHMFLESLNALVEGGLFQSVALKVLSEGPCEAAQEVIDMLEKRKTEPNSAQHLIALLHAFENLHRTRGAFEHVSHLQDPNIFSMRQISQGSWEIKWNANCYRRP